MITLSNIYKCTDFVSISNISEVWIERTYSLSVIHVSVGGCTLRQAMYLCYHRLISWCAMFGYCRMCWLLVKYLYCRRRCCYAQSAIGQQTVVFPLLTLVNGWYWTALQLLTTRNSSRDETTRTWCIPSYLIIYLRLSTDIHRTVNEPVQLANA